MAGPFLGAGGYGSLLSRVYVPVGERSWRIAYPAPVRGRKQRDDHEGETRIRPAIASYAGDVAGLLV